MEQSYTPTQEDIKAAWTSASDRFGYPPIRESITIHTETHPSWSHNGTMQPFVRMHAIPQRFHDAITQLSLGSTCPYIDDARDTYYMHDVYRWLRAIGVEAEFEAL